MGGRVQKVEVHRKMYYKKTKLFYSKKYKSAQLGWNCSDIEPWDQFPQTLWHLQHQTNYSNCAVTHLECPSTTVVTSLTVYGCMSMPRGNQVKRAAGSLWLCMQTQHVLWQLTVIQQLTCCICIQVNWCFRATGHCQVWCPFKAWCTVWCLSLQLSACLSCSMDPR